jgi:hypothetical protein
MGVIQGGTEFVVAAYVVTALVLGGYLVSVVTRFLAARRAAGAEAGASSPEP